VDDDVDESGQLVAAEAGRFLVVSWDGGGNTTPALNLGGRLVRDGHHVTVLGWSSMAAAVADAGLAFAAYPSMPPWPDGVMQEDLWTELVEPMLHGPTTVAEIVDVAQIVRPDVLVIDCMMGAAFAAAAKLGLPTAVLVHVRYRPFVDMWGDQVMRASAIDLLSSADRVLALTAPGFDGDAASLPANTTYVGPILPAPANSASALRGDLEILHEPGDPWVLLSLSTTEQGQRAALPPILEALGGLPIRVLLTLGGVLPVDTLDVPTNVTVRGYVPHARVLPYVAAVVYHSGLSTITATLAHGVPLVCIPQGREQPLNAQAVGECGAGWAVAIDANPAEIAAAVRSVLSDDAIRAAAARFADADPGRLATSLVERLLSSQR
jgi:UDP:flavonoid glycosyltransferase YjiC (YdhE family)